MPDREKAINEALCKEDGLNRADLERLFDYWMTPEAQVTIIVELFPYK